jgi:exonuclease SbcC
LKEIDLQLKERKALELDLKEALKEQAGAKAENPVLREEMDTLKSRIDQLTSTEGAVCPLCGQALNEDERNNLIEELSEDGKIKGDKYRANVDLLAKADEKVNALEGKVSKLMTIDENNRNLTRRLDQIINQENTILEEQKLWETEGAKKLIEIEGKLKTEDFALKTRKTLAKIDEDLKNIGYQVDAHDAERKRELALRSSDVELRKLEHARATLAPLEREIKELEENLVSQGKDLGIQETEFEKAAANLAVAITESPDIFEAENQMLSLQEDENRIRLEVGAAQQEVNVLDSLKKRTAELAVSREYLAQKVAQHKSLERAFGKDGVPAMLIEQALPQIEVKANEILERLSGGSMSINFSTQTAYKDKSREDLRETLDIIISDIAGQRDYEMYSGGEAFRINFAIRLALSEVLAQRAGARLQTLVIDEGFGSQDEIGRQRLIQAINLVKEDFEKILVITHIDSLKDAFPTRIEVEKSETGSTVNII